MEEDQEESSEGMQPAQVPTVDHPSPQASNSSINSEVGGGDGERCVTPQSVTSVHTSSPKDEIHPPELAFYPNEVSKAKYLL